MTRAKFSDSDPCISVPSILCICFPPKISRSPKTNRRKSKVLSSAKYSSRRASTSLAGDVEKCQMLDLAWTERFSRGATIEKPLVPANSVSRSSREVALCSRRVPNILNILLLSVATRGRMVASCASDKSVEKLARIEDRSRDQSATRDHQ